MFVIFHNISCFYTYLAKTSYVAGLKAAETRWKFSDGAQRDTSRHLKNSAATSLCRNDDLLTQHHAHTFWGDTYHCTKVNMSPLVGANSLR